MLAHRGRFTAQHPHEFVDTSVRIEVRYGGVRAPIDFLLAYGQLVVGTACDLVQVGDGEYLMVLAQVSEKGLCLRGF